MSELVSEQVIRGFVDNRSGEREGFALEEGKGAAPGDVELAEVRG